MRRYAMLAAKVVVTAALLYYAAGRVSLDVVGDRLYRLQYAWMLLALAICFGQLGLIAIRWRIIAANKIYTLGRCGQIALRDALSDLSL